MDKKTFIISSIVAGSVKTPATLGAAYDLLMASPEITTAAIAPDALSPAESNKVDAWLKSQAQSPTFDALRVQPFKNIRDAWIAAGSP